MKSDIIKCLKREGVDRWLLTEPHLLYLETVDAQNYLEAMKTSRYSSGFHSDAVKIITKYSGLIVGTRSRLCLVDLGPGYPDKTLPIAQYCKDKLVSLQYVPVDINQSFLDIATAEVRKYTTDIKPIQALFEECADKIPAAPSQDILVMIGLTFMNFSPNKILSLLKKLGGQHGRALIACEILSPGKSIDEILRRYRTPEAQEVAFNPIRSLGAVKDDITYSVEFKDGRIEMSFQLRRALANLPAGSNIVTAVSYRYTESELRQYIQPHFNHMDFIWSENTATVVGVLS